MLQVRSIFNTIFLLTLEALNGSFVTHHRVSLIIAPVPVEIIFWFFVTFLKLLSCVPWTKINSPAVLVLKIWLDIPRSPDGSKLTHDAYNVQIVNWHYKLFSNNQAQIKSDQEKRKEQETRFVFVYIFFLQKNNFQKLLIIRTFVDENRYRYERIGL